MMDRNIEYNFSDNIANKTELIKRLCNFKMKFYNIYRGEWSTLRP